MALCAQELPKMKYRPDSNATPSEVNLPAWGIAGRLGLGSPGSADSDGKATNRNSPKSPDLKGQSQLSISLELR